MRSVFFDARSLRDATNLPLLGVVTLVSNPTSLAADRKDLRKFLAGFAGLVLCYAGGVAALALMASRVG
jgi:hypothetical protein